MTARPITPAESAATLHVGHCIDVPGAPLTIPYWLPASRIAQWARERIPPTGHVVCTHPYVVDLFPPSSVIVHGPNGATARLSEHPRATSARGLLTTGELYTATGDDWPDTTLTERAEREGVTVSELAADAIEAAARS